MVFPTPKNLKEKVPLLPKRQFEKLTAADVADARAYVRDYWPKLIRENKKDDDSLIGQPYPYLVPSYEEGIEFDYNELYYWDSYFMVQGLMDEQHKELVMGILEDLCHTFRRMKIIPNASRLYLTSRSQPPFLSTFILEVYQAYDPGKKWLQEHMAVAQEEYETVWMGTRKPNARLVYQGLSRYYDFNYLHDIAETESGWDLTPRFGRKCMDYLPVDLNSLLYKYEKDFAYTERLLGKEEEALKWERAAESRRATMDELMWAELRGLYYDYNYVKKHRGNVNSLAAYYTMWAGVASEKQAARLVSSLRRFEERGGLATTDQQLTSMVPGAVPTQWAWPNGWAPLHLIVVRGLRKYGYEKEARRIALRWINTNSDWFKKHGVFLEKYNVVQPEKPPAKGVYPGQTGFGWTNSVFELFCQEFLDGKS